MKLGQHANNSPKMLQLRCVEKRTVADVIATIEGARCRTLIRFLRLKLGRLPRESAWRNLLGSGRLAKPSAHESFFGVEASAIALARFVTLCRSQKPSTIFP